MEKNLTLTSRATGQLMAILLTGARSLALWLAGAPLPRLRPATERSRGDVPGWVLITLMSAVLVAGLLAIAGPALAKMFNEAMAQVHP